MRDTLQMSSFLQRFCYARCQVTQLVRVVLFST